jgi:GntR family transcriptional regulator
MRRRSDVAETLRQHVISARHFGTLPADSRLPSARTLAAELRADPRVVAAAYRELEREGLVERRPPSRAFFALPGRAPERVLARPADPALAESGPGRARADDWLADVLAQALERDIPVPAFPEHARRAVETLRLRAACVECNTDQLVWLCREVREDYGIETAGIEADVASAALSELGADGTAGRSDPMADARTLPLELRRADLLVTTPAHAPMVQALAERTGKVCVVATQRADLVAELERLLARGPVYFVGTDPRFASKLRALFAISARPDHVRPVILGQDGPEQIPAGAPAYVMRTARDRLGGVPAHVRVLSTLRAFSRETRIELLRYVVRVNGHAAAASAAIHASG